MKFPISTLFPAHKCVFKLRLHPLCNYRKWFVHTQCDFKTVGSGLYTKKIMEELSNTIRKKTSYNFPYPICVEGFRGDFDVVSFCLVCFFFRLRKTPLTQYLYFPLTVASSNLWLGKPPIRSAEVDNIQ